MMPIFAVTPYIGVGNIYFGMNKNQVHNILGNPDRSIKNKFPPWGETEYWHQDDITVIYSEMFCTVEEISFGAAQTAAEINEIKFFNRPGRDVYADLCKIDGMPKLGSGFTILFNLGIALSGFLVTDQEERVVTVFKKGVWSENDQRLKSILME